MRQNQTETDLNKSGLISGGQDGVHAQLEETIRRHLGKAWKQPFHAPTVDVYKQLSAAISLQEESPLVLDSGCGTGSSTKQIAKDYPGHLVIGVDQSASRLTRGGLSGPFKRSGNCVMVRAELATFWRLLLADGVLLEKHYLLYPNPWPKSGHLARRWHGHPVFPDMLSLGGEINLRCNWEVYALEFARAVEFACGVPTSARQIRPDIFISPFEKKYRERGHALYEVTVPASLTSRFRRSRIAI